MFRSALLTMILLAGATSSLPAQIQRASSLKMPTATSSQRPHPAVVRIYVAEGKSQSIGSGTLIDVRAQYGLVITNWHVIRDAVGEISVVFPDGFRSAGRVVHFDKDWDLAAVSIWRPQAPPVTVALEQPQPGEMLTIAGYGSEGQYRAVAGACTQYLAPSDKHPYELVELAASARQGDSGGPIFNSRGELAGVLFGSVKGTTAGSYGGRVWKFVEPLLQPNAVISAPEKSTPAPTISASTINVPFVSANTNASPSAPPLIADPEKPLAIHTPLANVIPPTKTVAPLEPVVMDSVDEPSGDKSMSETGMFSHAPFPYRTEETNQAAIAMPNLGFNSNNPALQAFLGHSPIEQAKAVFAVIGAFTVLSWLWRMNQPAPTPVAKK